MKKKTKLLILSVIASLAFTSAFAACGKKGGDDNGNTQSSSQTESSSVVDSSSEDASSSEVVDGSSEDASSSEVVDSSSEDASSSEVVDGSSEDASSSEVVDSSSEDESSSEVVDSSSEDESSSEEQKDETAPVFSAIDETQFEGLKAGDKITIPTITATDETDGEVNVFVSFGSPRMPMPARMGEEFSLDMAGTYLLKYEAWDAAENYAVKEIHITVEEAALTVSEALAIGVANASKVTNGTIVYTNNGTKINDITYELAENYAHVNKKSEHNRYGTIDAHDYYIGYGENGVLWLQDEGYGDGLGRAYADANSNMVKGYAFEYVVGEDTYYGVESFLNAIYALDGEKTEACADGVYTFAITQVGFNSKKVYDVSFTLNNDIFDTLTVKVETYYANAKLDENGEYVYDEEDNLVYDGTFGTKDEETGEYNADSSSVYTMTQATDGEVTVAYNPDELLVKSYKFTDADGNEILDTVDAVAGTRVELFMADIPESAILAYDKFECTLVDSDGITVDDWAIASIGANTDAKKVNVTIYVAGEYTLTVQSAFVTKKLTVNVEAPDTTEIYAYANYAKTTTASIYDDGDFTFEVKANAYADASAEVDITSAPEGATGEITTNEGKYVFTPDEGIEGDYVITITSLADDTLSWTVTVTVAKAPAIETILTGKYQNVGKNKNNNLSITFDADNPQVLVIFEGSVFDWNTYQEKAVKEAAIYEFAYDAETRKVNLTFLEMGDDEIAGICLEMCGKEGFTENENVLNSITVNADYTMSVTYYNQSQMAKLEAWEELKIDYMAEVAGEYRFNEYDADYNLLGRWILTLNNDGTGAFYHQVYSKRQFAFDVGIEFNFTVGENYAIEITEITSGEIEGFVLETVNDSIVWAEDMQFGGEYGYQCPGVSFTFNGETMALEKN